MSKLFVVVDMQNDFVTGPLGTPETQAIVPVIQQKIKDYWDADEYIIYTADTHTPWSYAGTVEGKNIPVHCVVNTPGQEIVSDLVIPNAIPNNLGVIYKSQFGACPRDLESWVGKLCRAGKISEIEVCGVCTDICVISNIVLLQTLFPHIPITVDSKAVAGTTPAANEAALEVLRSLLVKVV